MLRALVRGPLLSCSGYGVHCRQIFKWLDKRADVNVFGQILPWGNTSWLINPDYENGMIGTIMTSSVSLDTQDLYDISFQVQLPNEWDSNLAKFNVGVTACVETDVCNPKWVDCANQMDLIIVPSEHARKTFVRSGVLRKPIVVVPESYTDDISDEDLEPIDLDLDTSFNFMMMGTLTGNNPWNDRKNTMCTLKWLFETFKDNSDVGIIIKTNSGRGTRIDRQITENVLKQVITEVRQGPYPKVHFVHGIMTSREVSAFYRDSTIKAFVSLTRGEGYGLPILEAAASGIPIIATNWSGHLDFLKHGKFVKVNYNLQEIHESRVDNQIFVKGSKWAEPSERDAKKKLKKFYEKPQMPKEWAEDLRTVLLEKYSHESISKIYDSIFDQRLLGK